jgi:hypothetical protein
MGGGVRRAEDTNISRQVAIKLPLHELRKDRRALERSRRLESNPLSVTVFRRKPEPGAVAL